MQYEHSGRTGETSVTSKAINFALGATLGIVVSWVTNCALAEISLNSFFAMVRRQVAAEVSRSPLQ